MRRTREGFMDFERSHSLQPSEQTPFLTMSLAASAAVQRDEPSLMPVDPTVDPAMDLLDLNKSLALSDSPEPLLPETMEPAAIEVGKPASPKKSRKRRRTVDSEEDLEPRYKPSSSQFNILSMPSLINGYVTVNSSKKVYPGRLHALFGAHSDLHHSIFCTDCAS